MSHKQSFSRPKLSPLEDGVLEILWPERKMKVREIFDILKKKRKVALTSVAVILDRLHKKGLVDRTVAQGRGGPRYTYFPTKNKEEFEQSIIASTVDALISQFGSTAVTYFNERFKR